MPEKKSFPIPPPIRKLVGPSFIILALGLGSGEVILWPYLASNYGLGIVWAAIVGITFQFFINMEIERYALVRGESVFVGIARFLRWPSYWFILSTFIGFGLPGIIAASAHVFGSLVGVEDVRWIAVGMLVVIGIVLSAGRTVYRLMERITRTVLLIGVPFIFILALFISSPPDWVALGEGLMGQGNGFSFFPEGIALATFLAAFAYSGAGGNLNLTQSIYVREKGYGMGAYAQRIAGLFHSQSALPVRLKGESCHIDEENISRFKQWWKSMNIEHGIVFWLIGSISMLLLMLLAFSTTSGFSDNAQGIRFVINEGVAIGNILSPLVGIIFLIAVSIMLFQTQLGVMDSTSRIMSENVATIQLRKDPEKKIYLSRIYSYFVWAQIAFGSLLFFLGLYEPKQLLVLGAVINAFAMCVHIALVWWLNKKGLEKVFQPRLWRKVIMGIIFLFFSGFSVVVLLDALGIVLFL